MKCSFVIPGYKCDEYIFRNIDSILDQDYTNYEIIPVLNGQWETRDELAKRLKEKYGDKINLHVLDRGNLGNANNYGIAKCTGDIVSCLSSDLYLMPGTLRTWMDAFKDHPDCDFVYSGYKYVSRNPMDVYYSAPYNRYHLECENFVDGANPVRREAVKQWSDDLPSLIDWDYFLSVTDSGLSKGYYVNEPLYFAEPTKIGGLSNDSSDNWVRRRRDIQARHNIPDRTICIASILDHDCALEMAKMADADFRLYPGHKPHEYRLIYQYGFMCDLDNIQKSTGIFFQHFGHKAIQWVGQDLLTLVQLRWYDVNLYAEAVLQKIKNHYCYSAKDQHWLKKIGVDADILYPPIRPFKANGKKNAVSVNEPELLEQLKRACPDIEFVQDDLDCHITVHYQDKPSKPLKSIIAENHVISNYSYPGVYHIQAFTNVPELRKLTVHTIREIIRKGNPPDKDNIEFYKARTSPKAFKDKLHRIAEKKIQKYSRLQEMEQPNA